MTWQPPIRCPRCETPLRKFAKGGEIPCAKCSGELCEKCCDQREVDLRVPVAITAELLKRALKIFEEREWDHTNAAVNSFCPDCGEFFEAYADQTTHHPSCEYVKIRDALRKLAETLASRPTPVV